MIQLNNEKDYRVCKVCRQLKIRILDGKFPNNKDKRYKDESGGQWMGNTCPVCHAEKMKEKAREKVAKASDIK